LDVGRRCGGAFNGIPVDRRAVLAVPVKQIRDIGDVS
jgi:hypothetical protein